MTDTEHLEFWPEGPYLQSIFLCDRILTEGDGVHSYIRVIDQFSRMVVGQVPEGEPLPAGEIAFHLVVVVGFGKAQGPITAAIDLIPPSGNPAGEQQLQFSPQDGMRAVSIHVPMQLQVSQTGRYDITVKLNGRLCGRHRFTVTETRMPGGLAPGARGL